MFGLRGEMLQSGNFYYGVEMTTAQLEQGIKADKYLWIYAADIDWAPVVDELKQRYSTEEWMHRFAFTCLLPTYDKYSLRNVTDFSSFPFYCHKWAQYDARDWLAEMRKVKASDIEIVKIRNKCLDLGVISPIHYNPTTRQAFNWLYELADKSGDLDETNRADVKKKLENLVHAYGGQIITNVFNKPEYGIKIRDFPNWRSGYFFERLIHEVYPKSEDLITIKSHELSRLINAKSNLVRTIRKGTNDE